MLLGHIHISAFSIHLALQMPYYTSMAGYFIIVLLYSIY